MRRRLLILLVILAAVSCHDPSAVAEAPPLEFVDNDYNFAFQFPADWKLQKNPPPGEAGEVRAFVKHPSKPMYVLATVGQLDTSMTRRQFEASPNRDAIVNAIMDFTIEQVYRKTSVDIAAQQMIVSERRSLPSNVGVRFYISTAHIKGGLIMLVAGQHVIPYERPYIVTFLMVTPVDKTAVRENEIITKIFNSFHLAGEKPLP